MGSGRRHRQVQRMELQGKITSISRYDAPYGRLSGAGEGFSLADSRAYCKIYLAHPLTVIGSTASGVASVAAAHAAVCGRPGGGGQYGISRC